MKKFVFTLGRMRDYKNKLLDREKNTLAQLRARKNQLDERIARVEQEREQIGQRINEETAKGTTALRIKCLSFQRENMRQLLIQLRVEQKAAEQAVETQLQRVLALSQEVAGLDKLEEKQFAEYQINVNKAEELLISEFVSSKLVRERMQEV